MFTSKARLMTAITLLTTVPLLATTASANEELTLTKALQRTLQHAPTLKRFPFQEREAEALRLQAGLRPTPQLNISIDNALGTDTRSEFDSAEFTLGLSQLIEMGDKRQARIGLSEARWQTELTQYEITRLELLAETGRRYYQLLQQQALNANLKRRAEREKSALQVIEKRQRAGAVASADAAKMRLRLAHTQMQQQQSQAQIRVRQAQLASLWLQSPDFTRATGDLLKLPTAVNLTSLLETVENSPRYQQKLMLERLAQADVKQQQSLSRSDIKLGLGVRHFEQTNDQGLVFDFSMPLAFDNPNRGNLQAAHNRKAWRETDRQMAHQQVALQLENLGQQLHALRQQAQQLSTEVLPKANTLLKEVEHGYRQGRYSVLQWVDAQSELFDLRAQQIALHYTIFTQRLELERISGQPLLNQTAHDMAPSKTGEL